MLQLAAQSDSAGVALLACELSLGELFLKMAWIA